MRVPVFFALLVLGCNEVRAQQIIDDSGASLSADERAAVVRTISDALKDPQSANFTKLTRGRKLGVCGYVNAKSAAGGYVGPRMFYADTSANIRLVLPNTSEVQDYPRSELVNIQNVLPIMEANCLGESGKPIM